MLYPLDDTIVAIASPPGGAARGIVRLSGPGVRACVGEVFQPAPSADLGAIASPRVLAGCVVLGGSGARMPCDLYFWPGPRSYTGQAVAEIHTLGSRPLLESLLNTLVRHGARLAEPGEFTLRAFLCGRIDLTRAEAVLGVIDAASPGQLDAALAQLAGGLAGPLHQLREELLNLLAHLEAGFDFADEDLQFISREELDRQLRAAAARVAELAQQMTSRGESAALIRAVLLGWPNTGKSSLFNALAGSARALVSAQAGTTRDYLTVEIDLDGVRVLLIDTAGIDPAAAGQSAGAEAVPVAAQAATGEQARQAHVRLLCLDASRPLNAWEQEELATAAVGRLVVLTKADAPRRLDLPALAVAAVETSSRTGLGLDELRRQLRSAALADASGVAGDIVPSTAARCRHSLHTAAEGLDRALAAHAARAGEELVAAEVRLALEELGRVVGAVYTDDVLDRIFSRFCIGK